MPVRVSGLVVIFTLFCFCEGGGLAQDQPPASEQVSLTVQPGVPLHIAIEKPLPIKRAGVRVEGHVVEPVYVFDHLVIPAGSEVLGHVTLVDELSRKRRALTIANGDFTPPRRAHLDFDTLVLNDDGGFPWTPRFRKGYPRWFA